MEQSFFDRVKSFLIKERILGIPIPEDISKCNYENIHKDMCKKIFDSIESGHKFYAFIDNYDRYKHLETETYFSPFINYSQYASSEEKDPEYYLHCSILTDEMMEYDSFIQDDRMNVEFLNTFLKYKPYFIEFMIPVYKDGATECNANIDKKIKEELSSLTSPMWFRARYKTNCNRNSEYPYVKGKLVECASPINFSDGYIEFVDKLNDTNLTDKINYIYNTSDFSSSQDVENVLTQTIKCPLNIARAYNIGHGNFIQLRGDYSYPSMIYDIGYITKLQNTINKKSANKALLQLKASIVIISHWDSDHYWGAYTNEKLWNVPWIAPDCAEKGNITGKRLIRFLKKLKKMYLIKRLHTNQGTTSLTQPFAKLELKQQDFQLEIYRGCGKDRRITEKNCEGIVVKITNNTVSTLMCGDVPYFCLSDISTTKQQSYEYMIVPHHCSEMDTSKLNKQYLSIENAIICEKKETKKKVMSNTHYAALSSITNKCYFTGDADLSLDFYLYKKHQVKIVNSFIEHYFMP